MVLYESQGETQAQLKFLFFLRFSVLSSQLLLLFILILVYIHLVEAPTMRRHLFLSPPSTSSMLFIHFLLFLSLFFPFRISLLFVRRVFDWRTRRVIISNLLRCASEQATACKAFDRWLAEAQGTGDFCLLPLTREEKINKMFQLRVAEPRGLRKVKTEKRKNPRQ